MAACPAYSSLVLGRRSLGTTIVGGMLLSTVLNLVFIPVVYVILRRLLGQETGPGRTARQVKAAELEEVGAAM